MLVDPATGMPMDGEGIGAPTETFMTSLLGSLPGTYTTTAWNMGRTSNTMIRGGVSQRRAMRAGSRIGGRGTIIEGSKETFSPRRFRRFSRARIIDPLAQFGGYGEKFLSEAEKKRYKGLYSPFGSLSGAGNTVVKMAANRSTWAFRQLSELADKRMYGAAGETYLKVPFDPEIDAFSRGTFGRMATMTKIGSMSEKKLAKRAGSITASVMDLEGKTFAGGAFPAFEGLEDMSLVGRRATLQGAVGSTIKGQISGQFAGYVQGAQSARVGGEAAEALLKASTEGSFFRKGVEKGISAFGREGGGTMLGKFAGGRLAAMGMEAAGPVGMVMLVHDIMKFAGKTVAKVGQVIIDAGKNVMGPLNKGVMGAQFRDNAVAATARQRGVMAINNSRLNMRSALGHEAAGMAAYYG